MSLGTINRCADFKHKLELVATIMISAAEPHPATDLISDNHLQGGYQGLGSSGLTTRHRDFCLASRWVGRQVDNRFPSAPHSCWIECSTNVLERGGGLARRPSPGRLLVSCYRTCDPALSMWISCDDKSGIFRDLVTVLPAHARRL